MTTATAHQNVRIHDLLDYIRTGRIMDAMHEFYADDVVMEEPAYGKTVGLAANLKREEKFVTGVAEFRNFQADAVAAGKDVSFYQNVMDWTTTDGKDMHVEQVVVAHWKNGKIVHERFYYNMA
ncbi:MAG: nuclear transport factor 2 family protein [Planctomycetes bacterium]|nr:nuclear transport factor 2 family protein [Planctomycetota bacterium]